MNYKAYNQGIEARATQLLNSTVQQQRHRSLWTGHALLATGGDPTELITITDKIIGTEERPNGGPFEIFPAALLLSRWSHQLPIAISARIEHFFTRGILQRGNTENHWLMYYTGNLLAAQLWPNASTLWNGLPPQVIYDEARRWILGIIERTARLGHHEYDSTRYHVEHMVPYIALADHANDAHLRHQAEQMLALLVADMALEYFHGAWAGGHSREGYRQNTWTQVGPVQGLHYLYFGDEDFAPERHCQAFAVPAFAAAYRPPAVLAAMALDRTTPHVVKKTKAPRNIYRHSNHYATAVHKYTYMSPNFALGSTQLGLPGAPAAPIDLSSWDLTWNGPKHQAKIVCNHPYSAAGRFSAFLSGLPQSIGRAIATDKPYLQYPDRLFGASPYERLMQHQGTLIALYNLPQDDANPYVNLFLPQSLNWQIQHGWLLADAGSFYIAIYPLGLYRWLHIRESNDANIMVKEGDLINGWLVRLDSYTPGIIIEAVEADTMENFPSYCQQRSGLQPDLAGWPIKNRIAVESHDGTLLEMHYDGPHMLAGQVLDYSSYPLYEAPGVKAELNTGRMHFSHNDQSFELDFGIDPDAPLAPMRVIG